MAEQGMKPQTTKSDPFPGHEPKTFPKSQA